jgi:hypothetical protein
VTVSVGKKPWIATPAIDFLAANIQPEWMAFEWGCGGSTVWLSGLTRCVISVETSQVWADATLRAVAEGQVSRVPVIHVVPPVFVNLAGEIHDAAHWTEGSKATPEWEQEYATVIDRFYPQWRFGLILIDGGVRHLCAQRALGHMLPGGLLVLDNSGNVDTLPATAILTEALGWGHRFVGPSYSETPEGECIVETGIWRMV